MSFLPLSDRVMGIKPSGIRKFFDIVNEMKDAISLGVGEPDFDTPWNIREEGIYSLEKGKTFYTANIGLAELREEICKYYDRQFDLKYDWKNEVIVTVGGSEAIDITLRTLINYGDEVIVPEPSFVCYTPCAKLAGAEVVTIPLKQENEFKLTAEELEAAITPKSKVLIMSFPNNPTGAYMNREELEAIAKVIEKYNLYVLSDEIYAELTFADEKHVSIANIEGMKARTVVISGFSKAFAMTGWRIGYMLGPSFIIEQAKKIHQYAIMCVNTTAQYAALEGLKNSMKDVQMMVDEYDKRRRLVVQSLNDMGLTCFEPKGAFYTFPCIKSTGLSSEEFAERLLMEKKVAVIPGNAFGESGEGYVRCCYAYSIDELKEALGRMKEFCESLKNEK